jgi:circadian clock protein KaiB
MERLSFILYTAGNSPNSVQAVSNLQEMCSTHFPDHHRIEIVDLSRDPQRGLTDGIMVTPTLMKVDPDPIQMIMGNLSDIPRVLRAISWNGAIKCVVGGYDANANGARLAETRPADQSDETSHE